LRLSYKKLIALLFCILFVLTGCETESNIGELFSSTNLKEKQSETTSSTETEKEEKENLKIKKNILKDKVSFTTKTSGKVNALIFMVDFSDIKFSDDCLNETEVEKILNSEEDKNSLEYPVESLKAFYKRASYNALNIDAKVYRYQAQNNREYYSDGIYFETITMEVLKYYDEFIDYSEYDLDKDGYIDNLTINVPINYTDDDKYWHGCQATWYMNTDFTLDNVRIKGYIMSDGQPEEYNMSNYTGILCHETGHMMGLVDYYKYNSENWEGFVGEAGFERMDDSIGDFCSFSKLMLGWIKDENVNIIKEPLKNTYKLQAIEDIGNCIIIKKDQTDSSDLYFGNYYIIEYMNGTKNNNVGINTNGIRVFEVNSDLIISPYISSKFIFKYENFSPEYDKSDNGIRVLKLLNPEGNVIGEGESIVLDNYIIKVINTDEISCEIKINNY